MPLLLTCDCGARFEVEEHLGGQEVSCPECLQAVKAVTRASAARLDWLALFSVAALVRIHRRPDALTGRGYALTGVGLGVALTAVTLTIFSLGERVPLAAWVRQRRLTGQLDPAGPRDLSTREGGG